MPRKLAITREMILEGAFQLVREQGHEALSVRSLAARLGCSTQPVLYQFQSVEELRRETYRRADQFHTDYLMALTGEYPYPMLEIGMHYIRFAAEEQRLFRFLFQTDEFSGQSLEELIADPEAAPLLAVLGQVTGMDRERVEKLFLAIFIGVHGYASLLANNSMRYDPAAAQETLTAIFHGLIRRDKGERE